MKKVYLFCSAGMSTSMLASNMQDVANQHNLPIKVAAFPHNKLEEIISEDRPDCILLGPQVRFNLDNVKQQLPDKPVDVIGMRDYGTMNGEAVINQVKEILGDE